MPSSPIRKIFGDAGLFSEEDRAIADSMGDPFAELGYLPDPDRYARLSDAAKRRNHPPDQQALDKSTRPSGTVSASCTGLRSTGKALRNDPEMRHELVSEN